MFRGHGMGVLGRLDRMSQPDKELPSAKVEVATKVLELIFPRFPKLQAGEPDHLAGRCLGMDDRVEMWVRPVMVAADNEAEIRIRIIAGAKLRQGLVQACKQHGVDRVAPLMEFGRDPRIEGTGHVVRLDVIVSTVTTPPLTQGLDHLLRLGEVNSRTSLGETIGKVPKDPDAGSERGVVANRNQGARPRHHLRSDMLGRRQSLEGRTHLSPLRSLIDVGVKERAQPSVLGDRRKLLPYAAELRDPVKVVVAHS